jgi:GDSL-like lipase/acylhydrolase family protein
MTPGERMWNSLTKYHPRIGFTFMPSVKSRIPWETGGYLVRTNQAGFRAEREFIKERPSGTFRAILFGDSQTAGDGVSNADRYSDVLAKTVPNLEVFNYGLPGSSTDQHYLVWQECANVQHNLLIIGLHVENIGQVSQRFRPYADDHEKEVIYAKPYYTLEGGALKLHHVPVPGAPVNEATMSAEDAKYVVRGVPYVVLRNIVKKLGMRDLMQRVTKFQPVPEYDSPTDPKWLLLRSILETWIRSSTTPVLLFLIPMWPFIEESSDPTAYQARFRELARDSGCHLHDPLPDLWKHTKEERRAFRFKVDSHFTPLGHQALAQSLAPVIQRMMQTNLR